MTDHSVNAPQHPDDISLGELLEPVLARWRTVLGVAFGGAAIALGVSFLIPPTFVSTTTFLPPQQQQSATSAALSSLGALAGLAGGAVKTPGDQYVAFMQSVTVQDRMIDRFKLMEVYDAKFRQDARLDLGKYVQIGLGKKDGLISVTVEDTNPQRAASMANQYVEELRNISSTLAVTEAQQRRVFFEKQWQQSKVKLTEAQKSLEASGFNANALKAEPKAAAEAYARLRAELATAEVKLQTLRATLTDATPEVLQLAATVQSLRQRLNAQESAVTSQEGSSADYITRYREFKYQETLFELMSRQYEIARVDESREGGLIQVVDVAQPAERKSKPKRSVFVVLGGFFGLMVASGLVIWRARRATPR